MAVLDQGRGTHGGVQGRPERPDPGLPRRRRRLYSAQPGSLPAEYRDDRLAGPGFVPGPRVPGDIAFAVAGAHAARTGDATFQHRSVCAGAVPAGRAGDPAGVTSGRPDPGRSFVPARITLALA